MRRLRGHLRAPARLRSSPAGSPSQLTQPRDRLGSTLPSERRADAGSADPAPVRARRAPADRRPPSLSLPISIARRSVSALAAALLLVLCAAGSASAASTYSNPVLSGDYPDPSIVRDGRDFYATTTTSNWAPLFPILHSRDLVNWQVVSAVFRNRPGWSEGRYWAPEITKVNGGWVVHYTAKMRGGRLCIGAATAHAATGPYTDRGPIVCDPGVGDIDPATVRDELGRLFLIWKEDGSIVPGAPGPLTRIFAQRLSEGGWEVLGPRAELTRNGDGWERGGIEGPFVVRQGGWFYLFYSGDDCCGVPCQYATGVARSRKLFGTFEKYAGNPILFARGPWLCAGHGSVVNDGRGRWYMLYHSYSQPDVGYVGRKMMLDRVSWPPGGWPSINGGGGPSVVAPSPFGAPQRKLELRALDDFTAPLTPEWQWPQSSKPRVRVRRGWLELAQQDYVARHPLFSQDPFGAILGRSTASGRYVAETVVDVRSLRGRAGLAVVGTPSSVIGALVDRGGGLQLVQRTVGKDVVVASALVRRPSRLNLRVSARLGHLFRFEYSTDGRRFQPLGGEVDGAYLPPTDLGVRVSLVVGGARDAFGAFDLFRVGR